MFTGFLYQKLEEAGFEVLLVDARQVKHVPGRKSDVQDCQWLQQLHSYGLLRAAFRPEDSICRLRTLQRQMQQQIVQCDLNIEKQLATIAARTEPKHGSKQTPPPQQGAAVKARTTKRSPKMPWN